MLSTAELLDLAKKRQGDVSDYRLAQLLKVKQPTMSRYRNGASQPENPVAMRLGELAGVDPLEAAAWVNLERSSSSEDREFWETMLSRLAATSRRKKAS